LIASVVALLRADAAERQVDLSYNVDEDLYLDGVQTAALRDSLSNLILNALQVTPEGGSVAVVSRTEPSSLTILVSDTGPGVPTHLLEKIWEPFFTTRQRGTGLGLAIVRKRMQEAGGAARFVPSANGGGATFELRLPLQNREQ
jgi:signal transduction histidine kinase